MNKLFNVLIPEIKRSLKNYEKFVRVYVTPEQLFSRKQIEAEEGMSSKYFISATCRLNALKQMFEIISQ